MFQSAFFFYSPWKKKKKQEKEKEIIPASIMPNMWANVALFCYFIWLDGIPLQKEMFYLNWSNTVCVW